MDILKLVVTQNGLRNPTQINGMMDHIEAGKIFDLHSINKHKEKIGSDYGPKLIQLSRFEDGRIFIADGHHRILSLVLSGRENLYQEEYVLTDWTYWDYQQINLNQNWYTPFDPRREVRYPDYTQFKAAVDNLRKISEQDALNFIKNNNTLYKCRRQYECIVSLGEDTGFV